MKIRLFGRQQYNILVDNGITMNMRTSAPSLLLTALLLVALVPTGTVAATPSEASEFYYGVEYDWSSLDSDVTNFTGLDIPDMLSEVMGAADDAGLNLIVGQLITGSSNVYVHHTENIVPQVIQDLDGEDVTVWSRTDDVTLRHGILVDGVFMTDWLEAASFGGTDTSFDIDATTGGNQVLTVDIAYTEYLDDDYNLVGADMDFSMGVSVATDVEFDAMFEGGGEEVTIDFDAGVSLSYGITESSSQWRLGEPSPIYVQMSANGCAWEKKATMNPVSMRTKWCTTTAEKSLAPTQVLSTMLSASLESQPKKLDSMLENLTSNCLTPSQNPEHSTCLLKVQVSISTLMNRLQLTLVTEKA
jgi:hypothetical protein